MINWIAGVGQRQGEWEKTVVTTGGDPFSFSFHINGHLVSTAGREAGAECPGLQPGRAGGGATRRA